MVRSAIADDRFLNYITHLGKTESCTVGLILGQPTHQKDYIIHLAKTPSLDDKTVTAPKKFSDTLDSWIADHAKHVTRMLPGGMYVLGIFVASHEDIFAPFQPKIKTVLAQIHKRLVANQFLYGNPSTALSEKLILSYCSKTKTFACKSYDVETQSVKPAEVKFQPKLAVKWLQIECKYELDQVFPIGEDRANWPLKQHMQTILESINGNLKSGVFMYDGEIRNEDDCLELIGKKKKVPRATKGVHHDNNGDSKPMQVTIILPYDDTKIDTSNIHDCGGQIKLTGQVASKIWLHPKATVMEASQAVIQDLVRSLAARLEMHLDTLIEEENVSADDTSSIHEPPRRVLVNLPNNKITLSDYLFPGEGPQEAQNSLQELLDIKIVPSNSIKDVEGQAELTEMFNENVETAESEEFLQKLPRSTNKYIYFTALAIAFIAFLISITLYVREKYFL